MTTCRGPLRLPRLLSAAACAAIVLAGCGTQPFGPHPGRAPSAGSPRQRAVADAAGIIASFPRPPGAVRTGLIASLTQPGERPATPDLAAVTQWWRVPGRPPSVLAWIHARLPSGFTPADFGGQMRLTFSAGPGGPALARLTAQYGGCGSVSVRIGSRDMPALTEYPDSGPPLQQQVLAIAGVSWLVQPGTPA